MPAEFEFDTATALSKGMRSYQEDAIIADFARGANLGVVVLADGMGGHAAGDVASKIVVTEVFSELLFEREDAEVFEPRIPGTLRNAAEAANASLREHVITFPETEGMGATLVVCVLVGRHLYWLSIGDSPLFLFRDGELVQLNEDHSMAPQIDFLVKSGLMPADVGENHPDRNVLTSVLFGQDIAKIDCPSEPVALRKDDILIAASDGLQFLSNPQIEAVLRRNSHRPAAEIVDTLMHRIEALEDPDLDNVSISLTRVADAAVPRARQAGRDSPRMFRCVG